MYVMKIGQAADSVHSHCRWRHRAGEVLTESCVFDELRAGPAGALWRKHKRQPAVIRMKQLDKAPVPA
jgi:hypothetical protein